MRILIAGGLGFIGGRLGQHLHQAGNQVVLGSRNVSSSPSWLPYAEVVNIDWNDGRVLEEICSGADVVIQAAGMNAQSCAHDPTAALELNGLATARLLQGAIHAGVKRFIYLSTAHVYASPLIGKISEDTCPRNLHPYATSHLAGENVVLGAAQRGQIEGVVLRLSNAYGAPADKSVNCWMLLVNDLCRQALETQKLVLQSSGLQQRNFITMSEVCRVVEYISACGYDALSPRAINVGSGISLSVLEMAQLIQQRCKMLLGFEPELHRPEVFVSEKHEVLEYRTDKLTEMGLDIVFDNTAEIDRLLTFCKVSFNKTLSTNS